MVSLTLIAIWILKQAREPLTCEEIIEQAQTQNFLQSPDPALEARLDAELNSDVNTRGAHSFFSKLAPRTFALNPDLPKLEDLPYYKELLLKEYSAFERHLQQRDAVFPEPLLDFVVSYLEDKPTLSIIDPGVSLGGTLASLVNRLGASKATGILDDSAAYELAGACFKDTAIDWKLGEPSSVLDLIKDQFDVIVSFLPARSQMTSESFDSDAGPVQMTDNANSLLLFQALNLMRQEGVALFVVDSHFVLMNSPDSVYANLERFGFFIDAIFASKVKGAQKDDLGQTILNETESAHKGPGQAHKLADRLLLIVRRQPTKQMFVGEITSEETHNAALQKNFKARKEGRVPQLGALVAPNEFDGLENLVLEREIEDSARECNLPPVPLSEFVTETKQVSSVQQEMVPQNSVYLPLSAATAPVSTSLSDVAGSSHALPIRRSIDTKYFEPSSDCIQVTLNPEKAIDSYVANFFNTALGQKIRKLVLSRPNKDVEQTLLETPVYLPDVQAQDQIIRIDATIRDSSTSLGEFERKLWRFPNNYKNIEKQLRTFKRSDDETWIETLPFPLASILWEYQADSDVKGKLWHLLHFFEALPQYNAALLLSAYAADPDFYAQHEKGWLDEDPSHKDWILHPSFGDWRTLYARLSKTTKRVMYDKDDKSTFYELFGHPDKDFLRMLTNKRVFSPLDEANKHRNRISHGGVLSADESDRLLTKLESNLSTVRQVLSDYYSAAFLVSPGQMEEIEGIYHCQAQLLKGAHPTFKQCKVRTLTTMQKGSLYLCHENQLEPVKVLPLFRILDSPKTTQQACYFYNGLQEGSVEWVSYHFESDPRISLQMDSETARLHGLFKVGNIDVS